MRRTRLRIRKTACVLLRRLYPRPFRQEFAAEMQQVFAALVSEAAQQRGHRLQQ